MITKQKRDEIVQRFENTEEKIIVSSVLDKAYRYEKNGKLEFTSFLNLNEYSIISKILNELKVPYVTFPLNEDLNRKVIFFLPDYMEESLDNFSKVVSCIKIVPKQKGTLKHKDYMGAIYNLGIKSEVIGDIVCNDSYAYVFILSNMLEYIILNLYKVGNQEVKIEEVSFSQINKEEFKSKMQEKEYIIPSLRCDAILATVYNLSRMQVKEKVVQGDLYINDKCEYYASNNVKEKDIVSFRKCGKLKIGEILRKTKNNNIVLKIYKYI